MNRRSTTQPSKTNGSTVACDVLRGQEKAGSDAQSVVQASVSPELNIHDQRYSHNEAPWRGQPR